MRYFRRTTHKKLQREWGFRFPIPSNYDPDELYVRVKKEGADSKRYTSLILTKNDLRKTDKIVNNAKESV